MTRRQRLAAASGERVFDAIAIVVSAVGAVAIAAEAEAAGRIGGDATFYSLLLAVVASGALWWRRRHPVAVAALFVPVTVATDFAGVAAVIALYTLITRRRGWVIPLLFGLHLLAGTGYSLLRPDPHLPAAAEFAVTLAFLTATAAVAVAMRARRDLVDVLRERALRAEEEARMRAERLRALERERIAREMHDTLAHRISMVSLHAGALVIRPDLTAEEIARSAATIRESAHAALEDLREILGLLRAGPDDLRPQPDLAQVGELVAEARAAGVPARLDNGLAGGVAGSALGRTVYRVVQEGLTNAAKHAPGMPVHVTLGRTGDGMVHVTVTNPLDRPAGVHPVSRASGVHPVTRPAGVHPVSLPAPDEGREPPPGAGAGLIGLGERVDLLGGRFEHGVRREGDERLSFRMEAWLPWRM
ncbi:histidine kinase [Actinoplanes sp. SE50]|uniref:sensor histidine kinase n=1 Tax=unclassified Actinoplanes TaxID=2626549 RepID=UPI00023EBDB4|nr:MULTISPECIES: histidine kinase [unclassified Actinoplanes]AEV86280.1 Oxygen sensor histidine kinase nreB [Actinoplanes sp. SE50/110]ATO84677.1 histidine kinase [Actinoplanes sp. SE50]SLM02087.1 two-component system sensor kinase [Actinoplanes sp. SE50/110]